MLKCYSPNIVTQNYNCKYHLKLFKLSDLLASLRSTAGKKEKYYGSKFENRKMRNWFGENIIQNKNTKENFFTWVKSGNLGINFFAMIRYRKRNELNFQSFSFSRSVLRVLFGLDMFSFFFFFFSFYRIQASFFIDSQIKLIKICQCSYLTTWNHINSNILIHMYFNFSL